MKKAIAVPITTARMLAKSKWNDLDPVKYDIKKKDTPDFVEVLVDSAPFYILTYGGGILKYGSMLKNPYLSIIFTSMGTAISALAKYWKIKEKKIIK